MNQSLADENLDHIRVSNTLQKHARICKGTHLGHLRNTPMLIAAAAKFKDMLHHHRLDVLAHELRRQLRVFWVQSNDCKGVEGATFKLVLKVRAGSYLACGE